MSTANCRPWVIHSEGTISALAQRLNRAITHWHQRWLPTSAAAIRLQGSCNGFEAIEVGEVLTASLDMHWPDHGGCVELRWGSGAAAAVVDAATGIAAPDASACTGVTEQTEQALAQRLLAGLLAFLDERLIPAHEPAAPPSDPSMKGSGSVIFTLRVAGHPMQLLLDQAAVRTLLGKTSSPSNGPPLHARRQALQSSCIRLRVEIGTATLPLADLLGLAPGQVLRLDLMKHQPMPVLAVTAMGNTVLALGRPGTANGRRAVQLLSPGKTPT